MRGAIYEIVAICDIKIFWRGLKIGYCYLRREVVPFSRQLVCLFPLRSIPNRRAITNHSTTRYRIEFIEKVSY